MDVDIFRRAARERPSRQRRASPDVLGQVPCICVQRSDPDPFQGHDGIRQSIVGHQQIDIVHSPQAAVVQKADDERHALQHDGRDSDGMERLEAAARERHPLEIADPDEPAHAVQPFHPRVAGPSRVRF